MYKKGQFMQLGDLAMGVGLFIVIAIVIASVLGTFETTLRDEATITNETITLVNNTAVSLANNKLVSVSSELINVTNASATLNITTDYTVDMDNGQITWLDSTYDTDNWLVSYTYLDHTMESNITDTGLTGTDDLVSWTPTIIAIAVGMFILGMIFVFGRKQ